MLNNFGHWSRSRMMAALAVMTLAGPALIGCGSSATNGANLPPVDDSYSQRVQTSPAPQQKPGMSTGTKVAILAGAAALYYMYKKNKEKRAVNVNSEPQYYLSKNGRVYYRTANGQAHYVTPPQQGIQVPYADAQQYRDFQGYNGSQSGRTLEGLVTGGN